MLAGILTTVSRGGNCGLNGDHFQAERFEAGASRFGIALLPGPDVLDAFRHDLLQADAHGADQRMGRRVGGVVRLQVLLRFLQIEVPERALGWRSCR